MNEILPFLPLLLLLACPLMMVFMMKGMNHGGHGKHTDHDMSEQQAALSNPDADELRALRDQLTERLGLLDSRIEELERAQTDRGREGRRGRQVRIEA